VGILVVGGRVILVDVGIRAGWIVAGGVRGGAVGADEVAAEERETRLGGRGMYCVENWEGPPVVALASMGARGVAGG